MPSISILGCIAVDLGSSNTYALTDDGNHVFSGASCILLDAKHTDEIYAIGDAARRFEGRTGDDSILVSPVSYGGVADIDLAAMLLLNACENCGSKKRSIEKSRLLLITPVGSTKVEQAALVRAGEASGAKHITIIKGPIAAAAGSKLHIEKAEARLVVSIGASVTEVSVISSCGVVLSRHLKTGSSVFDAAIAEYIRRETGLLISYAVADELKRQIGSAMPLDKDLTQTLSGKSVRTGRPVTASVTTAQLTEALRVPIDSLTDMIGDALYNIPVEFSGDILKNGILLTGGGSCLYQLSERLKKDTTLPVIQSDDPCSDTVRGAVRLFQDDKLMRMCLSAHSAYEV